MLPILDTFTSQQPDTMSKNFYKGILVTFMTYHHGKDPPYNLSHKFTSGQLQDVIPQDFVNFFSFRAYGVEDPTDQDCPIEAWSNTLEYWKKALSSFMPNRHMQWNNILNVGNPTRFTHLNYVIKRWNKPKFAVKENLLKHVVLPRRRNLYTPREFYKKRISAQKVSTVFEV